MTITEYARHRGCELNAVQYAVSSGRIERQADGKIDSEKADRDWEANTHHAKARNGHRRRQDPEELAEGVHQPAAANSFAQARAARELFAARLARLEFERRQGNLLLKRSVEIAAHNRGRILRDALFNLPNRIAAQLAAESDPAAVHGLLENEIRVLLDQFAGGELG
ncbi:MAG TPA: hypothetical protein VGF16_16610 [Bryobacteraceae bacterium]